MGENQLELDVVLRLQLDDTGEEIFKNIQNAARRAGKQIESAFNFGKIVAGVKLIQSTFNTLNTAIQKNVELTAKMVSGAVKGFGEIASAIASVTYKISGLSLIVKGVKNIFELLTSRLNFGDLAKQSLELASSLTEVNNVVSQVFGDSAKEIAEFSETAVSALGMSTVSARQFAGRFGAALKAAGQGADNVKYLSKELVKLTSDLSSFYDIAQDEAADKLFSGVLAGQVRPLRALGVELSNTAMQEYLTQQGVTKLWKEMSLAEKQVYRFKKTMSDLSFAQGDYSRTINSTSNQLRLLVNQLKELGTVVGSIINAFFNPFIRILNNITASAITAAKALANLLGIDWTGGLSGSIGAGIAGIADTYDEIAGSAEGLSDAEDDLATSTDKAGKAAKKALAPFHKLNILQNKDTSKTSGGGAGSNLTNLVDNLSDVNSELQGEQMSLRDRLKAIADAINEFFDTAPDKVQKFFDELQPKLKELADLFNYFIEQIDFYDIGRTISEIIEGIGRSIGTLADTLDFAMFGKKFADFVNGLVDNADMFIEWGHAIGKSINNAFDFIKSAVEGIHWDTLGTNLAKGLEEALKQLDPDTIHDAIYGALTGITTTLNSFFEEINNNEELKEKIKDSLSAIITAGAEYLTQGGFKELVTNIADFIVWALEALTTELDKDENKKAVAEAIETLLENGARVLNAGEDLANIVWEYVSDAITQFFLNKDIPVWLKIVAAKKAMDVSGITDAIESTIMANLALKMFTGKTGFGWIIEGIKKAFGGLKGVFSSSAVSGGLSKLAGIISDIGSACAAAAPYIASIAAIIAEFFLGEAGVQKLLGYDIEGSTFAEKWESFWSNFAEITTNAWNNTVTLFTDVIPGVITGLATAVGFGLDKLGQTIATKLTELGGAISDYFAPVKEGFETAFSFLVGVAATIWEDIKAIWSVASQWFVETVWTPLVTNAQNIILGISTFFNQLWSDIQNIWASVSDWFINTVWTPLVTSANQLYTDIIGFFTQLWEGIQGIWSTVVDWFNTTVWVPLTETVSTLKESIITFFTEAWEGIQEIWNTVVSWFEESVWTPLTDAVDTLKKTIIDGFGNAVDTVKEKWEGFVDFFEGIYNKIKGWLDDLIDKAKEWAGSMITKGQSILYSNSNSSIRGYARGGVFMPNKPQLAILGDQRSGVNVETPLSTMIDAFTTALQGMDTGFNGNITIPIYVDGTLSDQKVIKAVQLHNYRSNGR